MSGPGASMPDRYIAAMVLSGVGDAMGFRDGQWEFCQSGRQIHDELEREIGGLDKLVIKLPEWKVSDDTVMHLATAEAIVDCATSKAKEEFYQKLAEKYIQCMSDMDGRAPGNTCMRSVSMLKPDRSDGYKIAFNPRATGCGTAMRAMCIGLRYPKPEDLPALVAVSIEAGRITHNCPRGYLGSLATALFTHYAIQGKLVREWGAGLMDVLKHHALGYIEREGRDVDENKAIWDVQFVQPWAKFLTDRGILDGKSDPVYDSEFSDVEVRHDYYCTFSQSGWPGDSGHDAPLIAYISLLELYDALMASGNSWPELCTRAILHGGDNDSTGAIAAAWFGALYGFYGVPKCHYEQLEYKERLQQLGQRLLELSTAQWESDVVVC